MNTEELGRGETNELSIRMAERVRSEQIVRKSAEENGEEHEIDEEEETVRDDESIQAKLSRPEPIGEAEEKVPDVRKVTNELGVDDH
jgi:hypothetical protein